MIVKVMYMVKRDSFYGHNLPMISFKEASVDQIGTKKLILEHTPDLGLCYNCRKPIKEEFTYLTEGETYLLLFCTIKCEETYSLIELLIL